jgi:hypothetical protein
MPERSIRAIDAMMPSRANSMSDPKSIIPNSERAACVAALTMPGISTCEGRRKATVAA